jgi:hypothetical protein
MAGRGPVSSGTRSRPRDQRRLDAELTVVESDDATRGPDLPADIDWPDVTRDWWETWRRSPQAQTFTDTDWSFLLDTAVLHMEFWVGDRTVAAELRLRAAKFGATPEDRARLKIAVGEPKGKAPAPRTQSKSATARKGRLLKAVEDGAT